MARAAGMPVAGGPSWPVQDGLLGCGSALVALWLIWGQYRASRDRRAVIRHLEALCAADPGRLGPGGSAELPPLPKARPWRAVATGLRDAWARRGEEFQELQHHRAALEVRWRRAMREVARSRAIVAALAEPVIAVDGFGEVVLTNPAAERLFPCPSRERPKEAEQTAPGPRRVPSRRLAQLLDETSAWRRPGNRSEEIVISDAAGRSRCYRVSAASLTSAGPQGDEPAGSPLGAVAVLHDMGREKALQKQNAEFVSAVTHEMKTPLAGIKAYVELLADGEADDEETREEFLGVISSQADRLHRLIENMLNLARIEAGVVQVSKQNRSLNELLDEAIRVVQPAAQSKDIQLVVELSPLYLGVLADRDLLLQAAINLLSNAVKYTPPGGRVSLRSRLADDQVTFEVEDTGVGLSPEDCRRIFQRFYRVKKDKQMASGTGLGLPLAKHIVEDVHGGQLTVHSTEGRGSTFTVALPAARAGHAHPPSDRDVPTSNG